MLNYDSGDIVNVGVGEDVSIRELAELVKEIVGSARDESASTRASRTEPPASCSTSRASMRLDGALEDRAPNRPSADLPSGFAQRADEDGCQGSFSDDVVRASAPSQEDATTASLAKSHFDRGGARPRQSPEATREGPPVRPGGSRASCGSRSAPEGRHAVKEAMGPLLQAASFSPTTRRSSTISAWRACSRGASRRRSAPSSARSPCGRPPRAPTSTSASRSRRRATTRRPSRRIAARPSSSPGWPRRTAAWPTSGSQGEARARPRAAYERAFAAAPGDDATAGSAAPRRSSCKTARARPRSGCGSSSRATRRTARRTSCWATSSTRPGRFDEAAASFERSIALAPWQATAYHGLVSSRRLTEADRPLVARILARLEATRHRRAPADDAPLRRRQGARRSDATTPARSSTSTPPTGSGGSSRPFDRDDFEQRVDRLIARFTPRLLRRPTRRWASTTRRPCSSSACRARARRSIERIVSSHPQRRRRAGSWPSGTSTGRPGRTPRSSGWPRRRDRLRARLPRAPARHRPGRAPRDRQDAVQLPLDRPRAPALPATRASSTAGATRSTRACRSTRRTSPRTGASRATAATSSRTTASTSV